LINKVVYVQQIKKCWFTIAVKFFNMNYYSILTYFGSKCINQSYWRILQQLLLYFLCWKQLLWINLLIFIIFTLFQDTRFNSKNRMINSLGSQYYYNLQIKLHSNVSISLQLSLCRYYMVKKSCTIIRYNNTKLLLEVTESEYTLAKIKIGAINILLVLFKPIFNKIQ